MSIIGYGFTDRQLPVVEIEAIIASSLGALPLDGERILVIIPDATRTMPLPLCFQLITRYCSGRAARLDFLVALGTHSPLPQDGLLCLLGITPEQKEGSYRFVNIYNHDWKDLQNLVHLGTIPASEISTLSQGRLAVDIPVIINRRIFDYDRLIVCGPVFPHEVVGISGGNKYFFPGISGAQIIDYTHWLGALITTHDIIGLQSTPVRDIIDRAASLIPLPRHAFCAVVSDGGMNGLFFGSPEGAHQAAANLSRQVHIIWAAGPYRRALAILPEMYPDIWTGSKGMYKVEPVIADGGEVILYAPHIRQLSQVHGELIHQIGYHVRDYYAAQWERFCDYPWAILAHSTHLRGQGEYISGNERARIRVSLATGISESECQQVNLGYYDPASINLPEWESREDPDLLIVRHAGEILYRLTSTDD